MGKELDMIERSDWGAGPLYGEAFYTEEDRSFKWLFFALSLWLLLNLLSPIGSLFKILLGDIGMWFDVLSVSLPMAFLGVIAIRNTTSKPIFFFIDTDRKKLYLIKHFGSEVFECPSLTILCQRKYMRLVYRPPLTRVPFTLIRSYYTPMTKEMRENFFTAFSSAGGKIRCEKCHAQCDLTRER